MRTRNNIAWFLLMLPIAGFSQVELTIDSAVSRAIQVNGNLLASQKTMEAAKTNIRLYSEIGNTNVNLMVGQYNSFPKNDNNLTITQAVPFPLSMKAKKEWYRAQYGESGALYKQNADQLALAIRDACSQLHYLEIKLALYEEQSVYMTELTESAKANYESGQSGVLPYQLSRSKSSQLELQVNVIRQEKENVLRYLQTQLQINEVIQIQSAEAEKPLFYTPDLNADVQVLDANKERINSEIDLEKSAFWPDLQFSYFSQTLIGGPTGPDINAPVAGPGNRFQGFAFGLSFPLWMGPQLARVKSNKLKSEAAHFALDQKKRELKNEWQNALDQYLVAKQNKIKYDQDIFPLAGQIKTQAEISYRKGQLSFTEYLIQLNESLLIQEQSAQLNYECELKLHQLLWLQGSIQ